MDTRPESLVAQIVAKHLENESAFRVDIVRARRSEWHSPARVDLHELPILVEIVVLLQARADLLPPILSRHELGEPFVQPHVRPVRGGDKVAEPLMRELVRDEYVLIPRPVLIR